MRPSVEYFPGEPVLTEQLKRIPKKTDAELIRWWRNVESWRDEESLSKRNIYFAVRNALRERKISPDEVVLIEDIP
jgi:hypothetical protein